jgi:hypothetical protein
LGAGRSGSPGQVANLVKSPSQRLTSILISRVSSPTVYDRGIRFGSPTVYDRRPFGSPTVYYQGMYTRCIVGD